ncbi:hypothetical protein BDA96_06G068100 [Sorghum bicolor]|uniref:Uncharacterized protein n=2 Tax=Sorghum bicolor TaxID=4558 RepID=A0A921QPG1_SORBI|nr:hypothetical protein BDA96_06G068100 [Sorghum bicolor]OQU81457.1 hypothetical protein SORBI_3006G061401 [Sorghum bicolor]
MPRLHGVTARLDGATSSPAITIALVPFPCPSMRWLYFILFIHFDDKLNLHCNRFMLSYNLF